jgi:glycosyltransferase involved in cell wall biosynthesis
MMQAGVAGISAAIANSRSVACDANHALGVDAKVVENAVDLGEFAPDGAALDLDRLSGLPPEPNAVRVGLVGTFARWKGHEVFLRALAHLGRERRVRGYVIGDAIYSTAGSQWSASELRTLVTTLGLDGRVGFTGYQPAAPALRSLDIVVHPATAPEPFGMSLAEALACGRAVITTALGGAHDIVEPDRTAVIVSAGDAEALANAIGRLAESSELRQRLGADARRAAEARFNPSRFVDQVIAAYERAFASTSAQGRTVA